MTGSLPLPSFGSHARVCDASRSQEEEEEREERRADVLGGVTFRLLRSGTALVADVLTLSVAQRPEVCGRGLGTRLVNVVKRALVEEAARDPTVTHCFIVAEAENMPKAQQVG